MCEGKKSCLELRRREVDAALETRVKISREGRAIAALRTCIQPLDGDRSLARDFAAARSLIEEGVLSG